MLGPLQHVEAFRNSLVEWFQSEGKSYPWRDTQDPWRILVSEVMLQQTQIKTVLKFYEKFLEQFPTPESLAHASEEEILSAWEGLGYYRRVRNLQKAALSITESNQGKFPRDFDQILALPGIGRYTAGAVYSFAFNSPAPIVDANVARVLARLFDYGERVDSSAGQKQLWNWAELLLSREFPREYNSAIMELGQTYCTVTEPHCQSCPVSEFCEAKDPGSLPRKKSKAPILKVDEFCAFHFDDQKGVLMVQESQRREGMWKFPMRAPEEFEQSPLLYKKSYGITRYRVTLHVYLHSQLEIREAEKWIALDQLDQIPIASPFRKALDTLLEDMI